MTIWPEVITAGSTTFASLTALYLGLNQNKPKIDYYLQQNMKTMGYTGPIGKPMVMIGITNIGQINVSISTIQVHTKCKEQYVILDDNANHVRSDVNNRTISPGEKKVFAMFKDTFVFKDENINHFEFFVLGHKKPYRLFWKHTT